MRSILLACRQLQWGAVLGVNLPLKQFDNINTCSSCRATDTGSPFCFIKLSPCYAWLVCSANRVLKSIVLVCSAHDGFMVTLVKLIIMGCRLY